MENIDYLALALRPAPAERPSVEGVAEPEALRALRRELGELGRKMTLCALTPEQQARLGVPLSPEERALALSYLRFAVLHRELAQAAGAPAEVFEDATDKDAALAQAEVGADLLVETTERGTGLLGAALTDAVDRVADWIEGCKVDPSRDQVARDTVEIAFGPLGKQRDRAAAATEARRDQQAARRARRRQDIAAAVERRRKAEAVRRVERAARKGDKERP